jgi:hypothetical protein
VTTQAIIAALDAEIARLQRARSLIAQLTPVENDPRAANRISPSQPAKRRVLSPEARQRIAAAQRRRWAKHKSGRQAGPLKKTTTSVPGRKTSANAANNAKKSAKQTVQVTRVPAKTRSERKPRTLKKAAATHALSSRAEVTAANKAESQA